MASNADRQKAFTTRMREQGFVKVQGWVNAAQAGDVTVVLQLLRENPNFDIHALRDTITGRQVSKNQRAKR